MADRPCAVADCARKSERRGWCDPHYRRWQKHGDPEHGGPVRALTPKADCAAVGCDRLSHTRGYCSMHYQRVSSTGTTAPPRRNGTCVIANCGHKEVGHSWLCQAHRHRLRAYGSTDPRPRRKMLETCAVIGCRRQTRGGRGWCRIHYMRWRKHGDPTATVAGEFVRQENSTGRRTCTKCKKLKPLDRYRQNAKSLNGRLRECDDCISERGRASYPAYRERHQRQGRERHLRRKYGLTTAAYDAMVAKQDGQCAVCYAGGVELHVDHDHETGAVRGLLCQGCNLTLGHVADSVEVLQNLIEYLRVHNSKRPREPDATALRTRSEAC